MMGIIGRGVFCFMTQEFADSFWFGASIRHRQGLESIIQHFTLPMLF